jgi:hypothetical protein
MKHSLFSAAGFTAFVLTLLCPTAGGLAGLVDCSSCSYGCRELLIYGYVVDGEPVCVWTFPARAVDASLYTVAPSGGVSSVWWGQTIDYYDVLSPELWCGGDCEEDPGEAIGYQGAHLGTGPRWRCQTPPI